MRLNCTVRELAAALTDIGRILPSNPSIPALVGAKVVADDRGLWLEGTDLEMALGLNVKADITEHGQTVVPAKVAAELLRKLDGDVELALDGNRIEIKYAKGKAHLPAYDAEQYPAFPLPEYTCYLELGAEALADLSRRVATAADDKNINPVFAGVLWEVENGRLTWVATDTHRLAVLTIQQTAQGQTRVVVPAKAIETVARLAKERVRITLGNVCTFEDGTFTLATRVPAGKFPAYKSVIPNEFAGEVSLETTAMIPALERALIVAAKAEKPATDVVDLRFRGDTVTVRAKCDTGEMTEDIPVGVPAELDGMSISFNCRYLLAALRALNGAEGRMRIKSNTDPVVFVDADGDYLHLVLPVVRRGY